MSLYLRKFTLFNWNCSSKIIFPNFEIFNLACSKRTCAFIFFTGFLARARPLLPSYARKAGFKFLSLSLFLSLFLSFSLSLSFFLSFSLSLWSPHLYVSLMDGRRKCRSKPRHKNKFETTLCQFFSDWKTSAEKIRWTRRLRNRFMFDLFSLKIWTENEQSTLLQNYWSQLFKIFDHLKMRKCWRQFETIL